jgi:lipopolysaccharide transport system permease protein
MPIGAISAEAERAGDLSVIRAEDFQSVRIEQGVMKTVGSERPFHVVIQPRHGWLKIDLHEVWSYRDLLWALTLRDIKLRYKQTALGILWVIIQPVMAAFIFAIVLGKFAKLPSEGSPYILFAFCGMIPWNLFSGALQRAGSSLVGNAHLISKVYFPRILVPISSMASVLVDFAVSLGMLVLFMLIYQVIPTWRLLTLPVFLLLIVVAASGAGLWLAGLNVYYRDFMHAMPVLLQIWMYATPVAYSSSLVPEQWLLLFSLNPGVAFVEGFRWATLGHSALSAEMLTASAVVSLSLFISGITFFTRVERGFADTI